MFFCSKNLRERIFFCTFAAILTFKKDNSINILTFGFDKTSLKLTYINYNYAKTKCHVPTSFG